MRYLTAVLGTDPDSKVVGAAEAVAHLLGVGMRRFTIPGASAQVDVGDEIVAALAQDDVAAGALGVEGSNLCWDVACRVSAPLLVVPPGCERTAERIKRVLLPLDGTAETAASVAGTAQCAIDAGAEVVAMHVFDAGTVPAFWDQAAHSGKEWQQEFVRRQLPTAVKLDLLRGRTPDEMLREAGRTGADLIVIGWKQDLALGRAATVRRLLTDAKVPVLLISTRQ
ncbi:universal stress protein [Nocardioides dilutus]